jgi:hypothetical protein
MRIQLSLGAALLIALASLSSQAGYLDFSANWAAPATVAMSKGAAQSCVMTCANIQTYSNLAGKTSGATVVAGPHTTPTDNKVHLTVRLYKTGHHEKSCHVYTGKNNSCNGNCSCVYVD